MALDETGKPSFNLLQGSGTGPATIILKVFDLLMWQGRDVRTWPLEQRRQQLGELVKHLPDTIRFSELFDVPLSELMRALKQLQLEGIGAKHAGSQYRSGKRSGHC